MTLRMVKAQVVTVAVSLMVAASASISMALPFFDFHGYSYLDGPPNSVGTVVTVPALLNEIQPDPVWPLETDDNEYTLLVEGLTIEEVSSVFTFITVIYSGGTIRLLEDPSMNATMQGWVPDPPNASVPGSFGDGDVLLEGVFTEMVMFFNTATGTGTVSGSVDWTGGSRLADLDSPDGWTYFGGVSNDQIFEIPNGYDLVWDPQLYGPEPIPVLEGSWGLMKKRFE